MQSSWRPVRHGCVLWAARLSMLSLVPTVSVALQVRVIVRVVFVAVFPFISQYQVHTGRTSRVFRWRGNAMGNKKAWLPITEGEMV